MKKSLSVLLLAAATVAAQAQSAPAAQQSAPAASASAPASAPQLDPKEYNAYIAAVNATDAKQQAQLMESFLQTYPNSAVKKDGLEILLKAYQKLNDVAQMKSVSQRLLDVDPNNLTALFVLCYLDHAQSQTNVPDAAAALERAAGFGTRGLQALEAAAKPQGYNDDQWNSLKTTLRATYLVAVGDQALQTKDYATAQQALKEYVSLQPTDINSIYHLALAYLEAKPPVVDGLFWVAKAASAAPQLVPYAKNQYARYHGSEDGFDALLASAKTATTIPAGFAVTPAPSPADRAAELVKKGPPEQLSFAEWQFILAYGAKDSVDQTWSAIKGKQVQLIAVLISAAPESLKLAGSVDDINAKKSDLTLTLKEPLAAARLPQAGTELTVQGTPSDYTATADAFNMTFSEGEVLSGLPEAAKKPAAGVHHKATQ